MNIRDKFKLKVLESYGTQYQELFTSVMTYANPGFMKVRPHGNIGDRGNDGWVEQSGEYYQVYAPEELHTNTNEAIFKVKADFAKLKSYWDVISPIKCFYYVLNDKFSGVSPHISKVVKEIKDENGLTHAGVFTNADLEALLFSLPDEVVESILGVKIERHDPTSEDKKKVRDFLDWMSVVFGVLESSGREAGYFFPSVVMSFVSEAFNDDWQFSRLISKNNEIADHQWNMRNQLIHMHNQVITDGDYQYIGSSFKYVPDHKTPNRNELIESKMDTMGAFIDAFFKSYVVVREYAA